MESVVVQNAWKARHFLGGFFITWWLYQRKIYGRSLRDEVWGVDGNGGHMLKIVTDLTDEEMARLKFVQGRLVRQAQLMLPMQKWFLR